MRCKHCYAPTTYDTGSRDGFCSWCVKSLSREEVLLANTWELTENTFLAYPLIHRDMRDALNAIKSALTPNPPTPWMQSQERADLIKAAEAAGEVFKARLSEQPPTT